MLKDDLTPAQRNTLDALARFQAREGRLPTVRELMKERGRRSICGTFEALRFLEAKGHIPTARMRPEARQS